MIPLWFVLLAVGIGLLCLPGLIKDIAKFRKQLHVRVDEEYAEELRKAQLDLAFRTNGRLHNQRHIVRADFQRGNFR